MLVVYVLVHGASSAVTAQDSDDRIHRLALRNDARSQTVRARSHAYFTDYSTGGSGDSLGGLTPSHHELMLYIAL